MASSRKLESDRQGSKRLAQIAQLEERLRQIKERHQAVESRRRTLESRRSRKADTRRKILVGAVVLSRIDLGELSREELRHWLNQALTRKDDRALFDLFRDSKVSLRDALAAAGNPEDLRIAFQQAGLSAAY